MRNPTVLIFGGTGFIGTHLALRLRDRCRVFATQGDHSFRIPGVTFIPLKTKTRDWIKRIIEMSSPDIIIYAAGSENPEWCERHPREAEAIHTNLPASLAGATSLVQPKILYLSSSFVFDGRKGNYRESDITLPSGSLGKYKISGENFIRTKTFNHVILRSSPLYGRGNGYRLSFLDRLRMALERKERIEVSDDQLHSFAPVHGLVDVIVRIIESEIRTKTFHYGGLTKITHFRFAQRFAERYGYDSSLLIPIRRNRIQKVGTDEETRQDFSLNSSVVAKELEIKPLLLEEGFDLIQKHLISMP